MLSLLAAVAPADEHVAGLRGSLHGDDVASLVEVLLGDDLHLAHLLASVVTLGNGSENLGDVLSGGQCRRSVQGVVHGEHLRVEVADADGGADVGLEVKDAQVLVHLADRDEGAVLALVAEELDVLLNGCDDLASGAECAAGGEHHVRHFSKFPAGVEHRRSDLRIGHHITLHHLAAELVAGDDVELLLRLLQRGRELAVEVHEQVVNLVGLQTGDVAGGNQVAVLLADGTVGTTLGDDGVETVEQAQAVLHGVLRRLGQLAERHVAEWDVGADVLGDAPGQFAQQELSVLGVLGDVGHVEGTLLRVALDGVAGVEHNLLDLGGVVNELAQFAVLHVAKNIRTSLKTLTVEQVTGVDVLHIGRYHHTQVLEDAVGEQIRLGNQLGVDRLLYGVDLCNG